jgi:hypothetical protein
LSRTPAKSSRRAGRKFGPRARRRLARRARRFASRHQNREAGRTSSSGDRLRSTRLRSAAAAEGGRTAHRQRPTRHRAHAARAARPAEASPSIRTSSTNSACAPTSTCCANERCRTANAAVELVDRNDPQGPYPRELRRASRTQATLAGERRQRSQLIRGCGERQGSGAAGRRRLILCRFSFLNGSQRERYDSAN